MWLTVLFVEAGELDLVGLVLRLLLEATRATRYLVLLSLEIERERLYGGGGGGGDMRRACGGRSDHVGKAGGGGRCRNGQVVVGMIQADADADADAARLFVAQIADGLLLLGREETGAVHLVGLVDEVAYLVAEVVELLGVGRDVVAVALAQLVEAAGAAARAGRSAHATVARAQRLQLIHRIEEVAVQMRVLVAQREHTLGLGALGLHVVLPEVRVATLARHDQVEQTVVALHARGSLLAAAARCRPHIRLNEYNTHIHID